MGLHPVEARSVTVSEAFRLTGRIAAITGAASGIGRAIAAEYLLAGAIVHLIDRDATAGATTAHELGGASRPHTCDVSDAAAVSRIFSAIGAVDILVNNAGVSHIGNIAVTTPEDFERLFRVNVQGVYLCTRSVVDGMVARGRGVILNMASVAGSAGLADRFAYSMTKGAVQAMTLSVARDYVQSGIRCNSISPGRVHTPFVDNYLAKHYPGREREMFDKLSATQPLGRMGQPAEIASLARFLASDEAAFITGSDYPIDGGFLNLHG